MTVKLNQCFIYSIQYYGEVQQFKIEGMSLLLDVTKKNGKTIFLSDLPKPSDRLKTVLHYFFLSFLLHHIPNNIVPQAQRAGNASMFYKWRVPYELKVLDSVCAVHERDRT